MARIDTRTATRLIAPLTISVPKLTKREAGRKGGLTPRALGKRRGHMKGTKLRNATPRRLPSYVV